MLNKPSEISCNFFSPGDGQFTGPPPTCPGDTFTFRCTVTGDGITIWRVGGTSECFLSHTTLIDRSCGNSSDFTVTTGAGFGANATSFSSTLSGTATSELNGTLVECFGPAFSREPENMVGNSTFQILGQYHVFFLFIFFNFFIFLLQINAYHDIVRASL